MDLTDTSDDVRGLDESSPDFDEWDSPEEIVKGGPIRERLLDVIVQLREPTKVSTIADRAGCDTETARDYLEWFASMGMVRESAGRPVRYERNDSYLRWRRIEQIRTQYSEEEIVAELTETVEALDEFRERFDAEAPDEVSLVAASREFTVEDAWEALSEWKTLQRRAALLDAARLNGSVSSGSVGRVDG